MTGTVDMKIHIDRDLDLMVQLSVDAETTVAALKQALARTDPTGLADPESFSLKPVSPSATPLRDDELLPSWLAELEICLPAVTPPPAPQITIALEASATSAAQASSGAPADFQLQHQLATPSETSLANVATAAGTFESLEVPRGCTVAQWKQLLGKGSLPGLLGVKFLYAERLRCHSISESSDAGPLLDDGALLPVQPDAVAVFGPGAVITSLEQALRKKLGQPDAKRMAQAPRSKTKPLPLQLSGGANGLKFFFLGLQGQRDTMEDRACAMLSLPGFSNAAMFGVFDGHGGEQVADLTARHLPSIIGRELALGGDHADALTRAFVAADDGLRSVHAETRSSLLWSALPLWSPLC